eukprot:6797033-Prymnesium_polylepis.1
MAEICGIVRTVTPKIELAAAVDDSACCSEVTPAFCAAWLATVMTIVTIVEPAFAVAPQLSGAGVIRAVADAHMSVSTSAVKYSRGSALKISVWTVNWAPSDA